MLSLWIDFRVICGRIEASTFWEWPSYHKMRGSLGCNDLALYSGWWVPWYLWKLAISNVPNGKRGTDEVLQSEGRMIQGCGNDSHIFSYSWNWFSGYGSQLSPSNVSSGMWDFKVRERHYSDVEMAPSSNWRDFLGLRVFAKQGLQSEGKAIQGCGNGLPQPMSTLILSVSCES